MNKSELLRNLREMTGAGMSDCKAALEEAELDLQKAVDIVKTKGLNIVAGRAGRVAADGLVGIYNTDHPTPVQIMAEINCQTDFVANSEGFKNFVQWTLGKIAEVHRSQQPFDVASVEEARKEVVSSTKENVVVRRWWIEETMNGSNALVFPYLHSNGKIGVLLTLQAPSYEASKEDAFRELGLDLAMQVAAMNPLAVSQERLDPVEIDRQKAIFETQLAELKKPQAAWPKIMEGKMKKWHTEVCLLDQESVTTPKSTVKSVLESVSNKLGGPISVVNFIRCQVGEGLDKPQEKLDEEVNKLLNPLPLNDLLNPKTW